MKIAIDISQIVYGTGVSVYTKELVRALLKLDQENEYLLYAGSLRKSSDISEYVKGLEGKFTVKVLPLSPKISNVLWNHLRPFKLETLIGRFDVLHTSDWTEPLTTSAKVTTVHDLSPILFPEVTPVSVKNVHERKLNLVQADGDLVIVPSESIKNDLIRFGMNDSLITVIPEAVNPELLTSNKMDISTRFGIEGKYILMVGTAQRKNISRAVEAFEKLQIKGMSLVVVGQASAHVVNNVHYIGFVTTTELSNLYKQAQLLLYPSLYEGFGLPIFEAFALGCPVVTSGRGALKEAAGDAAVLVDPESIDSISKGIVKALKERSTLMKKGTTRVKDFSWNAVASATLAVYKKAYDSR